MARILHLSDVHLTARKAGWRPRDLANKHATGWINWAVLRRGKSFADADAHLERFRSRVVEYQPDLIVFSGDACALGFPPESARAAEELGVDRWPGLAVPGNHDYYTRSAAESGAFETAFAPWQIGERVDGSIYPFARQAGGVWWVGVNSAVPNRGVFDARGIVDPPQLDRLGRLLQHLPTGPRVLVTHYPYCTAEGSPEPHHHALRNREALAEVARLHGIRLWLCGHRHQQYLFGPADGVPFQVVCAGSATHRRHHGWWEIELTESTCNIVRAE
ncbi:MAG: metallophosphoesterase [Gemmataceae bacterium]|nr:metallophosphoesterase [Gemmataceae bacterium]